MTHSTENRLVKQTKQFGWGNILTIICMAGCCFVYANTKYERIMAKLSANESSNAVIQSGMTDHDRRLTDIERFKEKLSTYYDKPRGVRIVIQNN